MNKIPYELNIDLIETFENIRKRPKCPYELTRDFARELSKNSGVEIDSIINHSKLSSIYHGYCDDQEVAVKVEFGMKNKGHSLFTEHKALKKLKHPNLLELLWGAFGISPVKGFYGFIIEEFIKGETISEKLEKGRLSVEETIKYFKPICEFMDHVFINEKLLLDIKPSNIMVDENGQIKFIDLATIVDHGHRNRKTVIGTIGHISIDAMRDGRLDYLADVYSMGILLYNMLTAAVPFEKGLHICLNKPPSEGEELYQQLGHMHFYAPRPSIRKYAPEVPEELERICHKMMAVKKWERYRFMDEIIWDLEKI